MRAIVDIIADVVDGMSWTAYPVTSVADKTFGFSKVFYMSDISAFTLGDTVKAETFDGVEYTGTVTAVDATPQKSVTALFDVAWIIDDFKAIYLYSEVPFHYGHPLEVINELAELVLTDANRTTRFPCIFLPMDFVEERNTGGFDAVADLTFILMTDTKPEYKAADRYTNSFDTVLYPLYDAFIQALEKSTELQIEKDGGTLPVHKKIDRLYWGKEGLYGNTANIFNDFIDAIEINDLKIKILKTC